jgi:Flp pilus assembly protein TadD
MRIMPLCFERWGNALVDLNQPANAIRPLERARTIASGDTATMHLLGEAYRRIGKLPQAVDVLRQCTIADPEQPACFVSLGVAEYQSGNRAGARTALEHAVLVAPELAESHNSLANAIVFENASRAITHYQRAIELNRNLVEAYVGLGSALVENDDLHGAREAWEHALKLNPRDAFLHVNLGTLLARSGDLKGAAQRYRDALAIVPQLSQAHLNLGTALLTLGLREEALTHLRQAAASSNQALRKAAIAALQSVQAK